MSRTDSDRGLQPERTVLAWRRTCLAVAAVGVAVGKVALDEVGIAAAIVAACIVILAVVSAWPSEFAYRRTAGRLAGHGAGSIGFLSLTAGLSVFAAAIYVIARAVRGE